MARNVWLASGLETRSAPLAPFFQTVFLLLPRPMGLAVSW